MPNGRYPDLVANDQLRQVFLDREDLSATRLAAMVGITRKFTHRRVRKDGTVVETVNHGGDGTAALRDLGLKPERKRGESGYRTKKRIREPKALRYAEALGVDPLDVGL